MSKKEKTKKFQSLLEELEDIVSRLESEELELEEAIAAYERGMELSRECHKRLDDAERKVELLRKRADGTVEALPFEPTPEGRP